MPPLDVSTIILLLCVGAFTAAAAFSDLRLWRIPNKLTIPAFALGLVYQVSFFQLGG
jgi:Flp pilus assembly protein protease CpaA